MEFSQVVGRALEVRRRFVEYETRTVGQEWTTAQLMQGFVVDVGDLMRLVMAKEGARRVEDADARLAHELSDCLWSVLVLADRYGIDLERAFLETQDEVERRLTGQPGAPPPASGEGRLQDAACASLGGPERLVVTADATAGLKGRGRTW